MKMVIDASMALAWIFEREKASEAKCADEVLEMAAEVEATVPWLWSTEIANALLVGERRKLITEAQVFDFLRRLDQLPIVPDGVQPVSRRDQVMALAREHHLTAYDATYLELALRQGATLATFDGKLATAMQRAGGALLPSRED